MVDIVVVGSFVQDFAFRTPKFPSPGETRIGQFATGPGGKGFNQAVAACRQGADALFIGACGDDMFGEKAKQFAADEKLNCAFETLTEQPSGAASIVIDDKGQNQIVVALGANDHLSDVHIDAHAAQISGAGCVVSQLESRPEATLRAFALARDAGVITLLNPAPINPTLTHELLRAVDVLVPNETEFAFACQHLLDKTLPERFWDGDRATLHALCRALAVPLVIITLGEDGCFVSQSDEVATVSGSPPYFVVPPADVTALDTTGAGDAFNGGLAAAVSHTGYEGLEAAVLQATQVAGLSVEKPGTAPAMPTRAERVQRFGENGP